MTSSIQEMQRSHVLKMLDLSSGGDQSWGGSQTFKVLVYDKFCKEVIAPLLKVGGLRNHGVSLHIALDTERHPLPDVPAVYFVEPTEENVRQIVQDLTSNLYESIYVNFASSVPRPLLQELAKGAVQAGAAQKVCGIFDRFVSFVSLSPSLFTLNMPEAYATIHSPSISDQMMPRYIARIVDGLLSVLITMKALPIIRCPANDPVAEMVSRQLDERIRELLRSGGAAASELFAGSGGARGPDTTGASSQRPLLCILDRDLDLVTMLNHTCTYQAMAHDILGMRLNRLTVEVDEDGSTEQQKKKKSYDVDESDAFWVAHSGEPFFDVAGALDADVNEFDKKRREMTASSGSDDPSSDLTGGLASAFSAIPEMTEKKRSIDMHTNIMTALLDQVKQRELANFYNCEDQLSSQSLGTSVSQVEQLFADGQKGTVLDKTRALMVLYLTKPSMTAAQLQALVECLQKIGGDTFGIEYLKHLSSIRNMTAPSLSAAAAPAASGSGGASSMLNSLFSTGESAAKGLFSAGLSGIKGLNIIPSAKEAVICQILDGLMDQKPGGVTENYLYLDPKAPAVATGAEAPRIRAPFRRAVAFVVGGGNYSEMQSIQEWAQKQGRQVTYGSTDLVSAEGFIRELDILGRQMAGGS